MKKHFSIFVVILLVSISSESFSQCPMCKTAVESSLNDGKSTAASGLNNGILYLLAAPYLAMFTVGIIWYRNKQKKKGEITQDIETESKS